MLSVEVKCEDVVAAQRNARRLVLSALARAPLGESGRSSVPGAAEHSRDRVPHVGVGEETTSCT